MRTLYVALLAIGLTACASRTPKPVTPAAPLTFTQKAIQDIDILANANKGVADVVIQLAKSNTISPADANAILTWNKAVASYNSQAATTINSAATDAQKQAILLALFTSIPKVPQIKNLDPAVTSLILLVTQTTAVLVSEVTIAK